MQLPIEKTNFLENLKNKKNIKEKSLYQQQSPMMDIDDADHVDKILPQMSAKQLARFAISAHKHQHLVCIQLNAERFNGHYLEIIGFIELSTKTEHIIIRPYDQKENSVFMVGPRDLRNIRRYI